MSFVSQFSLGSNLCCGFLIRSGVLLICHGGLLPCLLHTGGLLLGLLHQGGLLRNGGLLLCLLHRGGLLPCLLCTGGLLLSLLRRGGLLPCLLRTGGLLLCLLHRGGRLSGSGGLLLRRSGLLSCSGGLLLRRGDPRTRLLCHGGSLLHTFCQLHHGPLFCRSCLSPKVLHLYMDLACHPSPLFHLRFTTLLDCCVMLGASGIHSFGGGGGLCHETGPWTFIRSPPEVTFTLNRLSYHTD